MDCFDMWHDYMKLSTLLQTTCDREEGDHGNREGPKRDCKDSVETNSIGSLSDNSSGGNSDFCGFCRQNKESAKVYRSHKLKSHDGKVTCPVLWSYTCSTCGATGDNAHTRRYCPQGQRYKLPASQLNKGPEPDNKSPCSCKSLSSAFI
uniref:Nanos-type domain-containing protein n=1 Tax=Mola mola TaxID=94237 RepID=A0A3Q3WU65_MOLML